MFHYTPPSPEEEKDDPQAPPIPPDESPSSTSVPEGEQGGGPEGGNGGEEEAVAAARPSTPPLVQTILDMGFSRAQVNVALRRSVDDPSSTGWVCSQSHCVSVYEYTYHRTGFNGPFSSGGQK